MSIDPDNASPHLEHPPTPVSQSPFPSPQARASLVVEDEQQRIWGEHLNYEPCPMEQFLANFVPAGGAPYVMPSDVSFQDVKAVEGQAKMYVPLVGFELSRRSLRCAEEGNL
jgi:hypothetical protein